MAASHILPAKRCLLLHRSARIEQRVKPCTPLCISRGAALAAGPPAVVSHAADALAGLVHTHNLDAEVLVYTLNHNNVVMGLDLFTMVRFEG